MTRLFFKLYVSILIGIIFVVGLATLYLNSTFPHPDPKILTLNAPLIEKIKHHILALIPKEHTLDQIGSSQRVSFHNTLHQDPLFQRWMMQTGWKVTILPSHTLPLSERQKKALKEKKLHYSRHLYNDQSYYFLTPTLSLEVSLHKYNTPVSRYLSGLTTLLLEDPKCKKQACQTLINQQTFNISQTIVFLKDLDLTDLQKARLDAFPQLTKNRLGHQQIMMLDPLNLNSVVITQLGFCSFDANWILPFFLILLLSILGVRFTLYPLKQKLSQFEHVATRFEQGEIDARVNLTGYGPIEHLATIFDRSLDRMQALIQSNETLLQAVSHELRTPISRLYFYLDLFVEETQQSQREKLADDVSITLDQLKTLTSKILDFNRISLSELSSQETLLFSHVVSNVITQFHHGKDPYPHIPSHLLHYNEDSEFQDIKVLGSRNLLSNVLFQLIKNAHIYAPGIIEVSLELETEEEYEYIVCKVDDSGEGIPHEYRQQVFEPFFRLDKSRNRNLGGVGLGLSMVQKIIQNHQGLVYIDDSPLGGTRVVFRVPLFQLKFNK